MTLREKIEREIFRMNHLEPNSRKRPVVLIMPRGARARLARRFGCGRAYVGRVALELGVGPGRPGRVPKKG